MIWLKAMVPLWLLLIVAVLGVGGTAYAGYAYTTTVREQRDVALDALYKADEKTRRIQKQVQTAVASANAAKAQLKGVLDASPEVRDAATPEPVRVSLCATLRCK
jgi:hypothetical protein